ncbi:lytic transglycosylase domain-containing protein [Piscinibacter gummiphilus]|uniref:lytic transglycosylase domain-containing protein n=1 Tax=Piscinibacter gummiphilus TaxID=946333 RepID=UPI0012F4B85F|nr:lytic transglycosylase domain-containing protein [Piscinibacter gummiphilus]
MAPRSPDTSRYAEQLWLYDRPAVRTPEAALPEPVRASPPVAAPTASVIRSSAPVAGRPIRGVSREASARALSLVPQISDVAARFRIDPLLLHAIAHVESRHNPDAVSHAGALGLMQVMPATARRFGVTSPKAQLHDPKISLEVSSAYLKTLQRRFDNNLTLVIAAYNAGEGAVEKYGRQVPPYKETQGYVRDVMAHYRALLSLRDAGATPAPARPML